MACRWTCNIALMDELTKFFNEFKEALKDILQNANKWCNECHRIEMNFFYQTKEPETNPKIWLNPKVNNESLGTFVFDPNLKPKTYKVWNVEYQNIKLCKCLKKLKKEQNLTYVL